MARAVCVRCGSPKRSWEMKCPSCGLNPKDDAQVAARSYMLSTERYDEGSPPEEQMGLPSLGEDDLQMIGQDIGQGRPYAFEPVQVRRVSDALRRLDHPPWWAIIWFVIRFAWPFVVTAVLLRLFLPLLADLFR